MARMVVTEVTRSMTQTQQFQALDKLSVLRAKHRAYLMRPFHADLLSTAEVDVLLGGAQVRRQAVESGQLHFVSVGTARRYFPVEVQALKIRLERERAALKPPKKTNYELAVAAHKAAAQKAVLRNAPEGVVAR